MEGKITNLKTAPKSPKLTATQEKIMHEAVEAVVVTMAMTVTFFFRQLGFAMSEVLERNTRE